MTESLELVVEDVSAHALTLTDNGQVVSRVARATLTTPGKPVVVVVLRRRQLAMLMGCLEASYEELFGLRHPPPRLKVSAEEIRERLKAERAETDQWRGVETDGESLMWTAASPDSTHVSAQAHGSDTHVEITLPNALLREFCLSVLGE